MGVPLTHIGMLYASHCDLVKAALVELAGVEQSELRESEREPVDGLLQALSV